MIEKEDSIQNELRGDLLNFPFTYLLQIAAVYNTNDDGREPGLHSSLYGSLQLSG